MSKGMTFPEALGFLNKVPKEMGMSRINWYGTAASPVIKIQRPDEYSFMTEPYYYMEKYNAHGKIIRFPVTLSPESQLADDWVMVQNETPQLDLDIEAALDKMNREIQESDFVEDPDACSIETTGGISGCHTHQEAWSGEGSCSKGRVEQ